MVRKALSIAAALLVGFHVALFARQLWQGELVDLGLLARWLAAGAIVWALYRLRRQGTSLFWGRKAVAIWSLAALLHGPAMVQGAARWDLDAVPDVVVMLPQATAAIVFAGMALLGVILAARRRRPQLLARPVPFEARVCALSPAIFFFSLAPRPPPAPGTRD